MQTSFDDRSARILFAAVAAAQAARVLASDRSTGRRWRSIDATLGVLARALRRIGSVANLPVAKVPPVDRLDLPPTFRSAVRAAWISGARVSLMAARRSDKRREAVLRRLAARVTRSAARLVSLAPDARVDPRQGTLCQ